MKKKLRSQSGASLILALLLFLVCAVLGSVVLTAGTAASGRLSELASMDQRYYAVTSAVGLLKNELDGKTVTIVRTKTVKETYDSSTEEYSCGAPEYAVFNPDSPSMKNLSNLSYLTEQTVHFLFGAAIPTDCTQKQCWEASFNSSGKTFPEMQYTLSMSGSPPAGVTANDLKVNVKSKMDPHGGITLTVSNAEGDSKYSIKVILVPSVYETTSTEIKGPDESGNLLIITTTETKRSVVTWKVQGIQ